MDSLIDVTEIFRDESVSSICLTFMQIVVYFTPEFRADFSNSTPVIVFYYYFTTTNINFYVFNLYFQVSKHGAISARKFYGNMETVTQS